MILTQTMQAIDLNHLRAGALIDVETRSRHYRIEFVGGNAIRISGHPDYCPDPAPALLQGSINEDGVVEPGVIEPGARLVLFLNDRGPITTSRIIAVQVDQQ